MSEAADKAYRAAAREVAKQRKAGKKRLGLIGADFHALERLPDEIAGWAGLQWLNLIRTQITDAGLAQIAWLTGLRYLYLSSTQITDAGLAQIAGLTGLQSLYLSGTQITDEGLAQIVGLTGLQGLDLSGTQITDEGLAQIVGLTGLQSLYLSGTQITDVGLAQIAGLTGLQRLDLNGTQVRDLRPLRDLPFETVVWGLTFQDTPAVARDAKLAELAEIEDDTERTRQTLAYLKTLPPYPQAYLFDEPITLEAILSAQTPLGWKFSPVHGALVVYIEETPLSQFQTQMAQQTALRAEDLKAKIGGANFGVRGDVAVEVKRLTDILADGSRSLSERSFDLWASLIALGGHLDSHDRGRIDGRDPLDLLSPEQRTALMTLLTIAGNFVRSFPQIKELDEGAGNFLRREVTLDMVAQMIEQALRAAFVAQQSAALMQHVAGVAKGTGGQADKATSVTVRGLGNLITSASLVIGRRVLQVAGAAAIGAATGAGVHVGEAVADAYDLEKPAIAFIERISGIAPELIDAMPADEAAQVRAALREAQDKIAALRAAGDLTRR